MFFVQDPRFFDNQPHFLFCVECLDLQFAPITDKEGYVMYETIMAVDVSDARQKFEKQFPDRRAGNRFAL